jgi:hypothetical protein
MDVHSKIMLLNKQALISTFGYFLRFPCAFHFSSWRAVSTKLALFLITNPYQPCLRLSLAIVHQPLVIVLLFLFALEFGDLSRAEHHLTGAPLLRTRQKATKAAPYRAILLQIEVQYAKPEPGVFGSHYAVDDEACVIYAGYFRTIEFERCPIAVLASYVSCAPLMRHLVYLFQAVLLRRYA